MSVIGKGRRRAGLARSAAVIAVSLSVALGTSQAVSAQADPGPGAGSGAGSGSGRPAFDRADIGKGLHFTPTSVSNRTVTVMLQMEGSPVAVRDALTPLSRAAEKRVSTELEARQDKIRSGIGRAGGRVVAQLQWAYNGVQVHVRQKDVAKLSSLPGVVAVHPMRSFKPANTSGIPFVGAPQTWEDAGATGAGVKIADIDTGIDYTHADFGGPGTVPAFEAADAADTETAPADLFGPTAPKVKGGYDLVGDDYDGSDPTSVPQPDPNPLDCNGHGTHTAGTAAGYGVLKSGETYSGPYKANTVSGNDWNVGPGVAPEADIYAYRVFGCAGSSDVVAEAIDRAVADHVDVITMSLGSDLGGVDDPTTVAAENATRKGISVVAAAGNAGGNAYMLSSPASGSHVLSVAAEDGTVATYPGARLDLSSGGTVHTINANGADLPDGSFPVKVLRNSSGGIALGCSPADYAGTAGAVVVTMRGTCGRVSRAVYGQDAGAAAVVMVNSDASLPPYEGPITSNPDTGAPAHVTIPFLGAAGTAENVAALLAADGGSTTLTPETVPNTGYRHTASFSSGGPRNPDSAPKPEVIAPGVSVASAGVGTGTGSLIESGTSMATPMAAGVAALVKQTHPAWKDEQIKAAIQNTADPALNADYDVRRAGTGTVQAQRATSTSMLLRTGDGLNSIAFGYVPGSGRRKISKEITLTNTGTEPATYALAAEANGDQRGAQLTVFPHRVTVPAGARVAVKVRLAMTERAFAALPSDDAAVAGAGQVLSVGGAVVATPVSSGPGQLSLRMAYLVVPRGLSDVEAGTPSDFEPTTGDTSAAKLPLRNDGIHTGTADVYAWGISDAKDTGGRSTDVRDVGVQTLPGAALGGAESDRSLVFAVNTWGPATNHSVDEFDIAVDNNGDGDADVFVLGIDLGSVLTGSFDGRFASVTVNAHTGAVVDAFLADAPMNGAVVELPALASELGLSSGTSSFRYSVDAYSLLDGAVSDTTGLAAFDAFDPAVSSGQFAELAPGASTTVPLEVDRTRQQGDSASRGWLVVSVDDASGAPQADEVAAPTALGGP